MSQPSTVIESSPLNADLRGIVAASLTPLTADGRIDTERLQAHIAGLLAEGCSFVSPFGSTGEGPSFSAREKREALLALAATGMPMSRLIPAAMSPSVDDVVAMLADAVELGCRAALIVPPYYYGAATQEGIADFFAACANRFGGQFPLDIILYHIPAMSRIGYGLPLIRQLLDRFNSRIVGIKDSTGDRDHTLLLAGEFPDLRIFTGDDRVLPALLRAGGAGMIGGLPNVNARDLCALYADPDNGLLADRAAQRIAAIDDNGGIIALKALKASMVGDPGWAVPKPPLSSLGAEGAVRLRALFAASQFQFTGGSA